MGRAQAVELKDFLRSGATTSQSGDVRVLELVASGAPLDNVLETLVRVVEEAAPGMLGSVLLVEDNVRVRHGAAPHLPPAFVAAIDGKPIGPAAGSCGTAAYRRAIVIVEDIATDPLWADYRASALAAGLRACWSVPVFAANGAVLGTFALYYTQPMSPSPDLLELTKHATHLAAIAIENHQRAQALRASEQHLSLVYEHVDDVLFHIRVDADGEFWFVSLNPAFQRATGLPAAQVAGKRVRDVIPEPSLSLVLGKYNEAIRTRSTVRWDEVTVYPVGKRFGEVAVTPVIDRQQRVESLIGSVRDVTDRRRLEEEMRQLQKLEAIGRLTSGIAHDFNNILGVILMRANMAVEEFSDPALREELREIIHACERGAALTRQFLAFSRKQVLHPEVININDMVESVRSMVEPVVGANIEFLAVLAPDLWRVEADPSQIEQVIMNLVINSKDAMPAGGKLTIETANVEFDETITRAHAHITPGQYVMLAVSDTGMGMNEETRQQIFEPFFTTKSPGKGTGLGLATVYGIVKQSRGDIWVYSEPTAGTAIKVYLPRTLAAPVPKVARPLRRPSGKVMLGHVLVVEDEPALRDTLARLLPQLRCSVAVASNAADAIAMIEEGPEPDLVITDIVMPGMTGTELVHELRKSRPSLKVLFISGYPDGAAAHRGVIEAGAPFLQKPFSINDLARCVEEALDTQA